MGDDKFKLHPAFVKGFETAIRDHLKACWEEAWIEAKFDAFGRWDRCKVEDSIMDQSFKDWLCSRFGLSDPYQPIELKPEEFEEQEIAKVDE